MKETINISSTNRYFELFFTKYTLLSVMNNLKCKEVFLKSQTFSKILIDMSENVTKSKN